MDMGREIQKIPASAQFYACLFIFPPHTNIYIYIYKEREREREREREWYVRRDREWEALVT